MATIKLLLILIFLIIPSALALRTNTSSYNLNFVVSSGVMDENTNSYNTSLTLGEEALLNYSYSSYNLWLGLPFNYTSIQETAQAQEEQPSEEETPPEEDPSSPIYNDEITPDNDTINRTIESNETTNLFLNNTRKTIDTIVLKIKNKFWSRASMIMAITLSLLVIGLIIGKTSFKKKRKPIERDFELPENMPKNDMFS